MRRLLLVLLVLPFLSGLAFAVNPDEVLNDRELEQRAREISAELRCLVCQNQSIDDSDAELARDLRLLVRERLVQGDSDQEVLNFIVARYGEFVLLNPVLAWHTILLWGSVPLLLILGVSVLVVRSRQSQPERPATLSDQEKAALDSLQSD